MNKIIMASVLLVLLGLLSIACAGTITPEEAGKYIGRQEEVCGKVVRAYYAAHAKGQLTLLNLDRFSRRRIFTVLIWGRTGTG